MNILPSSHRSVVLVALCALLFPVTARAVQPDRGLSIIPLPASIARTGDQPFVVTDSTPILYSASPNALESARRVALTARGLLTPSLVPPPRVAAMGEPTPRAAIRLILDTTVPAIGSEGYSLVVTRDSMVAIAREAAGLFYALQTIRQLMPVSVEHAASIRRVLSVPEVTIMDSPRFAWRGAMLDVSRHFLEVDDVKRFVDAMALYKLNRLHLHLSDDQGWRIEIKKWPALTAIGGRSEVGGGVGGFYTQAQYVDIVRYASERHITVVPEIEMPGHSNAALSAIPALNCNGVATKPFTGITVGFSTMCASSDTVFSILNDIVREVAALTPGEYLHIGGDEVEKLGHAPFLRFIERAEKMVRANGKRMIGWGEIAPASLDPSTIVQHWRYRENKSEDSSYMHAARGGMIIASPGSKAYFDMKYDSTTVLGLRWAGLISTQVAYEWNPAAIMPGVEERSVLGVEGPLWSETLEKRGDVEYMAFPRMIALAEIGWTQQSKRRWENFRGRLSEHGPRLQALGLNFYRAPDVPWKP